MDYSKYGDMLVCAIPENSELDMVEIEKIVEHTHNTWQHDRPIEEIRENTIQGKRAEIVIERLLEENSGLRFLSYDAIRKDDFEKHAPFDGILVNEQIAESVLQTSIDRINSDVESGLGDSGLIKCSTREFLENNGVFTLEIKSSLLQNPRDYKCMENKSIESRTKGDYEKLCKYIKSFYDYIVYPHYSRDNQSISSFYDYAVFVRNKNEFASSNNKDFLCKLMEIEFNNACNIYTRVFFDLISNEIIIPGYIMKTRFFEEPRIMKMPSPKSANAIYYMFHMQYGKPILEIDKDDEIKQRNRINAYKNLFAAEMPKCEKCGEALRLVETQKGNDLKQHKFLFVCNNCKENKWSEVNKIYSKNMKAR